MNKAAEFFGEPCKCLTRKASIYLITLKKENKPLPSIIISITYKFKMQFIKDA